MKVVEALCKKYGIIGKMIKERMEKNSKDFKEHGILKKYWKPIAIQELLEEVNFSQNKDYAKTKQSEQEGRNKW